MPNKPQTLEEKRALLQMDALMTLILALQRIADMKAEEPTDEWAEAEAFHTCRKLARKALKAADRETRKLMNRDYD